MEEMIEHLKILSEQLMGISQDEDGNFTPAERIIISNQAIMVSCLGAIAKFVGKGE